MKAVVAEINFFDNQLVQKLIEYKGDTQNWKDAYLAFLKEKGNTDQNIIKWVEGMPDSFDDALEQFYDGEMAVSITFLD